MTDNIAPNVIHAKQTRFFLIFSSRERNLVRLYHNNADTQSTSSVEQNYKKWYRRILRALGRNGDEMNKVDDPLIRRMFIVLCVCFTAIVVMKLSDYDGMAYQFVLWIAVISFCGILAHDRVVTRKRR